MSSPVVALDFQFRDRKSQVAELRFYLSSAIPMSEIWSFVDTMAAALHLISNARIEKATIYYKHSLDIDKSSISDSADISRGAVLYFENTNGEIEPLFVVSPKPQIFETSGDYAGIRVNQLNSDVQSFIQMVATGFQFRTKDNRRIGPTYLAGCLLL